MNLRDKLRAMDPPKKPAAVPQTRAFTSCWSRQEIRELGDFLEAFQLRRTTVDLMCGALTPPLPADLDPTRILYLDTETTGLAGGTGTVAFLVGLGQLTREGFIINQYVMRDYPEERYVLAKVEEALGHCDVLCTFNGRTFDIPLLRDRFLLNRMQPDCLDLPHIDLLHIARRVWKMRLKRCTLSHLENAVLGMPRLHDLPGSEAPRRYFDYLKTGEFALLDEVLTHNAQDIASLCTLLSAMAHLYEHPSAHPHEEDVFSMGVALERFHHPEEARQCYHLASRGMTRTSGQLYLARSWRRSGKRQEATAIWLGMIDRHEGGIIPYVEMAKHYEHVERNLPSAMDMTQRAMMLLAEPTLFDSADTKEKRAALQHRYDRLKQKMKKE